jgi:hypothetical protein
MVSEKVTKATFLRIHQHHFKTRPVMVAIDDVPDDGPPSTGRD